MLAGNIGRDDMQTILVKAARALSEIDPDDPNYVIANNAFQVAFNYFVNQGISPAVIHQALGTYDRLEG